MGAKLEKGEDPLEDQGTELCAAGGGGHAGRLPGIRAVDVPWGWSRRDLSPVLRELREEGLTALTEDPDGEILSLRLTQKGERELAAQTGR